MEPRLIIAGFGPFPGVSDNPSSHIVQNLHYRDSFIVNVSVVDVLRFLREIYDRFGPNCFILWIGVDPNAHHIWIERGAINQLDLRNTPDARNLQYNRVVPIDPTKPLNFYLQSQFPIDTYFPSSIIRHSGGTYISNFAYYHSLRLFNSQSLYIHVPLHEYQ